MSRVDSKCGLLSLHHGRRTETSSDKHGRTRSDRIFAPFRCTRCGTIHNTSHANKASLSREGKKWRDLKSLDPPHTLSPYFLFTLRSLHGGMDNSHFYRRPCPRYILHAQEEIPDQRFSLQSGFGFSFSDDASSPVSVAVSKSLAGSSSVNGSSINNNGVTSCVDNSFVSNIAGKLSSMSLSSSLCMVSEWR